MYMVDRELCRWEDPLAVLASMAVASEQVASGERDMWRTAADVCAVPDYGGEWECVLGRANYVVVVLEHIHPIEQVQHHGALPPHCVYGPECGIEHQGTYTLKNHGIP